MTLDLRQSQARRLDASRDAMRALLQQCIAIPSVSGAEAEFVEFLARWATQQGFEVDVWETDESTLPQAAVLNERHLPLAGRPTAVIRLPGTGGGRSLIFNGHTDVVPAGDVSTWKHDPWAGDEINGCIFGRGACDVKGPIASALWAMLLMQDPDHRPAGDVLLELVPGEEDCVGLGTLTSVARGWTADACIVLEPTENDPRCASRPGLRFEITIEGTAVHGTMKWLGRDAIAGGRQIMEAAHRLETQWNDIAPDPLFATYPIARPITIDAIHGGTWAGMLCDRCVITGYVELLPGDTLIEWQERFESELRRSIDTDIVFSLSYNERYAGHRLSPDHELCATTRPDMSPADWQGFNSGCEAGLRAGLLGTPTLVWGPGSLAQAHAADEYVRFADVENVAAQFVHAAQNWCHRPNDR